MRGWSRRSAAPCAGATPSAQLAPAVLKAGQTVDAPVTPFRAFDAAFAEFAPTLDGLTTLQREEAESKFLERHADVMAARWTVPLVVQNVVAVRIAPETTAYAVSFQGLDAGDAPTKSRWAPSSVTLAIRASGRWR
ncbi:MAG: hypothetical protein QM811_06555 [Pirellulales bacterium]